jgi:Trk-type K+ transport system membrane component
MLLSQLIPFAITSIQLSLTPSTRTHFLAAPSTQEATVNPYWSTLFVMSSAFTGTGFSLVDMSAIPFANSYTTIYCLIFSMTVGNHAMPMAIRFCIWLIRRCAKGNSQLRSTLGFLLDHPRRCFLYLFPRHQTWYLVLVLVAFIVIEMIGYLALNIGLPVLEDVGSGWQRFTNGLFQSLAVRASGLSIIAVANLAPATLVL